MRLLVLLLLVGPLVSGSAAQPGPDDLAAAMASHQELAGVPGVAWAVVDDDGPRAEGTLGVDGDGHAVTPHTPFLLGLLSKAFTAALVLRLAEQGRLDLDQPVVRRLSWFRTARSELSDRITARQLLEQTSGLDAAAGLADADRATQDPADLRSQVRALSGVDLADEPGASYRYSSANYLVLGALVEQVTGERVGDLMRRTLLDRVGMADAVVDPASARRLPPGHRLALGRAWPYDPGYVASGVPYGYVGASLTDLEHAATDLLSTDANGAWPAAVLDRVRRASAPDPARSAYRAGWRVETRDGVRYAWHSGATPGSFATLVLLPDLGLAVVLLQNGYSPARDAQLNGAAFDLVRLALGQDPRPTGPDPVLLAAPWLLTGLGAALLVPACVVAVRRRRHTLGVRRRGRVVLIACDVVVLLAATAVVLHAGPVEAAVLGRWAPDVFWAAVVLVAAAAASLVACLVGVRRSRSLRKGQPAPSGAVLSRYAVHR
ncbi:serine hydrolase domain-containing protein [Nocardioides sp. GXQ0305]|uniref:serine hydrolase domain-containing protein n=1 Tax=Nocardioides sp. GXQ0305 TaxID=3423912 RepID=UPI003D7D4ECB